MPSERAQRQIDRLLDEAERAFGERDWALLRAHALDVFKLDAESNDAQMFLAAADQGLAEDDESARPEDLGSVKASESAAGTPSALPSSFAAGRYEVKRFLGEGGKKKVYLAHDTLLDRDVAFALIKTEGLDETGRDRIKREAQAMGRLGSHPHIVSVFDLGEEADGQPYIVTELMGGGDVEGLIEKAPEHRPPLERTLEIGIQICRGLEFAHSHGIVHRDLKPGNVWLTSPPAPLRRGEGSDELGVAKLGDFGLAVALDKSRLTQAGMMVGTVSYMPPEQAMGGEVTPRSDLYSLGAMLYEMVTGRPPFVGDESVAIITQHLNTAPVSPSWHNPQTPAVLETLILHLLEKDPSKRPARAKEVRESLASIASGPSIPAASTESYKEDSTDNPLYRRVFVGREVEIRQLQSAFDLALSGKGALAMVVGEPGIGKTAVCEQLATYVTLRGGTTLTGHCYEEGSLSLPYLAFVEALRSYAISRPPEALRQELGTAASDLARIVSEVRERLSVEPRPPGDPEEDRWRLLEAVSGFLRNASAVQPLLLVLEDLHWADQGTLDLLVHLARNLQGARLLVIGTYRDVEVDRSHPLSATLAEFRRGAEFGRVLLRGLGTPEVHRMLVAITGAEVPGSLAESIHRQTEGNPLFVQEVVRYLVEEGHLGHGTTGATTVGMSIPEGLRDVIGRRLSRLSPDCNRVLAVAAVIGRDFGLETLQTVVELDEEQVVSSLEEALKVGVLEEQSRPGSIRYRFAHAFFRQTLYEELIAPRRLRLHQQVAAALERQYANRLEEHAAELAEHFSQSTDAAELTKAVHYGELGAQRALAVYAYGEAVRHLEQALAVQEVLDPDDTAKRCDLLLALGESLLPAGEPMRAAETLAQQALQLAENREDRARASRACRLALAGLIRFGAAIIAATPGYRRWAELADRYAAPGTADRAVADQALARLARAAGRVPDATALSWRALALARELDDAALFFEMASGVVSLRTPENTEQVLALAEEVVGRPRLGVDASRLGQALWNASTALLCIGERDRAEQLWRELAEPATRTRDPSFGSLIRDMWLATLDGELENALAARAVAYSRADEMGATVMGRVFGDGAAFNVCLYLGRVAEALEDLSIASRMAGAEELSLHATMRLVCLALLGRRADASALLDELLGRIFGAGAGGATTEALVNLLEAAVLLEDRNLAGRLAERLAPLAATASTNGTVGTPVCIGRHLGAATALLGDREAARRYYEQSLDLAGRMRHRPEIALTHLGISELMLSEAGERAGLKPAPTGESGSLGARHASPSPPSETRRAEALAHLDFAIGEFREMKMQPSLERALRHMEVLKA